MSAAFSRVRNRPISCAESENSSVFAGLLGKILPQTLAADESGGGSVHISFVREIVFPDGRRLWRRPSSLAIVSLLSIMSQC
jgi:hypothetical protein